MDLTDEQWDDPNLTGLARMYRDTFHDGPCRYDDEGECIGCGRVRHDRGAGNDNAIRQYPLEAATAALHAYRGHDSRRHRVGEILSSGGLSLIFPRECSCFGDAAAMFRGLLDAGYVVEDERATRA